MQCQEDVTKRYFKSTKWVLRKRRKREVTIFRLCVLPKTEADVDNVQVQVDKYKSMGQVLSYRWKVLIADKTH